MTRDERVTDEMVERSHQVVDDVLDMALYLRNCPPENIDKYQDAANRLAAFMEEVRAALSAALSEQTLPVRVEALKWNGIEASSPVGFYRCQRLDDKWEPLRDGYYMLPRVHGIVKAFATLEAAKAAAQSDYESRIRSALVDVQAVEPEPVGEQWCAFEDGHQHTSWYPDGYGDRAGWEALAKRNPVKYQIVTRPLYAHPPTTRIADSAETGGSATLSKGISE